MTFNNFKKDFFKFLESSTVNLGRRNTKTRKGFIDEAMEKFDAYISSVKEDDMGEQACSPTKEKSSPPNPMSGSVMRIKPNDKNKALDSGKGTHSMTASESMRADEQLGRSPYSGKTEQKGSE